MVADWKSNLFLFQNNNSDLYSAYYVSGTVLPSIYIVYHTYVIVYVWYNVYTHIVSIHTHKHTLI